LHGLLGKITFWWYYSNENRQNTCNLIDLFRKYSIFLLFYYLFFCISITKNKTIHISWIYLSVNLVNSKNICTWNTFANVFYTFFPSVILDYDIFLACHYNVSSTMTNLYLFFSIGSAMKFAFPENKIIQKKKYQFFLHASNFFY
jgi:hypothetical protein